MPPVDDRVVPDSHYDALVIGCGMSGLGAAIRLAMYGKRVLIAERHHAPGGLNGFYFKGGRKLDVGLHAMTNFAMQGARGPLSRIFRQLRIKPEDFALCPQLGSRISFPGMELRFGNGIALLEREVEQHFPQRIDAFRKLVAIVEAHDALDLSRPSSGSARQFVHETLGDPLLAEMILCPLFFYGSAVEDDIDFDQFCILFRALYLEGFARPYEGVRRILRVLLNRYRELGGERLMKCGVKHLASAAGRVAEVVLDNGRTIRADHVISSIGSDETMALFGRGPGSGDKLPRLSFAENIFCFDKQPRELGWQDTIVFFSTKDRLEYRIPSDYVDDRSGVICIPNNYDYGERNLGEGMLRVTSMANHDLWTALDGAAYAEKKSECSARMLKRALSLLPGGENALPPDAVRFHDMFTPRTVKYFTGHIAGGVYGSPAKVRDGHTPYGNLYLCGTDQGFLGIVGALLGGISMANKHVLAAS
jgi:phytoene dehydrogenase-like protein